MASLGPLAQLSDSYTKYEEQTTDLAKFIRGTGHAGLITSVLFAYSLACFVLLILYFVGWIPAWPLLIIVGSSAIISGVLAMITSTYLGKMD